MIAKHGQLPPVGSIPYPGRAIDAGSDDPDAIRRKTCRQHFAFVPQERCEHSPRAGVPDTSLPIFTSGDNAATVSRKSCLEDRAFMA